MHIRNVLTVFLLAMGASALEYICTNHNNKPEFVSEASAQTKDYYPHTVIPQDSNIPVTLGVNNYLYKEKKDDLGDNSPAGLSEEDLLDLVYHEIDVKVIDTYFDSLYVAYPANIDNKGPTIFQSRYRDNLDSLFRIRYSTFSNSSCLGSQLIQFKMVFIKDDALYKYFFGNCNSTEVFYDDFNKDSYCIPMSFFCYDDSKDGGSCVKSNYSLALEQAQINSLSVINSENNQLSIEGSFPTTSVSCLHNDPCLFSNFKTFDFSKASYTPVFIDSIVSTDDKKSLSTDTKRILTNTGSSSSRTVLEVESSLSLFPDSLGGLSSDFAFRPSTGFTSYLMIFLYMLGF